MTIGLLATALGLAAGWFGSRVDAFITWLYTVVMSIPDILLIMAIASALGKGLTSMCLEIAASFRVGVMRLVRGEVLKHKEREYVLAAQALSVGSLQIRAREILPKLLHVAVVIATLVLLCAVKFEVILTFLGLGIQDGLGLA